MKVNKKIEFITKTAEELKAQDIKVIDLRRFVTCGEFYVIMTATSWPHIRSLVREFTKKEGEAQITNWRIEGMDARKWILIDCGDILIHIFLKETREFYNIERLWSEE